MLRRKIQSPPDSRVCVIERFEERLLKASDLFVFDQPAVSHIGNLHSFVPEVVSPETSNLDVNGDGLVSTDDAEVVLNFLVARQIALTVRQADVSGEAELGLDYVLQDSASRSADVNDDGEISPLDVLQVVNRINFYNPLTPCNCAACVGDSYTNRCEAAVYGQIQNQEILSGKASVHTMVSAPPLTTRLRLPSDIVESILQSYEGEPIRPL